MLGSLGSCVLSSVSGWLSFKRVKPKNNKRSGLALTILAGGVILAIFGLLAIYDASVVEGYKDFSDKFHFVKQQAVWLVIGIVVSLFAAGFPLATLKKYSHVFLLGCLFLMVLVLIPGIGSKFLGARRWIIFGPIVIQPSELIKIALILYLARWLEVSRSLKQFLALLGLCLGLVMLQPDLGTGVVIVGTCFILYYLSGANLKDISIFMGLLVITMSVLVFASPYRMNRLKTFMDPTSDPLGASYHINQVLYGLGSGGLTGVGVGQSRQKFAYLPEATTDSIFVIIAEEFGFIGGAAVILGLVGLCLASLNIAAKTTDRFDKLLSSGVSLLFLTQIFVNLGAMTALMPLTGVPLPFISYGGSSLVTNFLSLGLLANVAKKL